MSEHTPLQNNCETRIKRWREIIGHVVSQISDLLWQREQIRRIGKMIDENERLLASSKPFLWDARRWYMFFAVMKIRSQADNDDDVYSLRRLLEEIRKYPECVNRGMVIALVRKGERNLGADFESMLVNGTWDEFANASDEFDVEALTRDIHRLDDISKQVRKLANKSIAHVTKHGILNEQKLTFNDLDKCIDEFDKLAVKYILLLNGAGMSGGTLMPTEQFDWYEQFTFAWKPRVAVRTRPDPLPNTPEDVRRWRISDPYDRYFKTRSDVIDRLFDADEQSIDAIALAGVALGTLAEFRFSSEFSKSGGGVGKDKYCFRRLLVEHCESFENRISIPEIVRAARRDPLQFKHYDEVILKQYPVAGGYATRLARYDPLATDFIQWAKEQLTPIPEELFAYDYAGCIHRHYRNSVIHELRVAKGREAGFFGKEVHDVPIYYVNGPDDDAPIESDEGIDDSEDAAIAAFCRADPVEYMRFGIYPPYLLTLLREAITSMKDWALTNDRDLFSNDEN